MTVYVLLPQVPLTLTFEEPIDEVAAHLQRLVQDSLVRCYDLGPGQRVVVNYAVQASITINEGHRTLEVAEMHRALPARIVGDEEAEERVENR